MNYEALTRHPPSDTKGDVDLETAANHVLHIAGYGGYPPGGFYELLIKACFKADFDNLTRISHGFPVTAWCVHAYKTHDDGLVRLQAFASPDPHALVPDDWAG